MSRIPIHKKTEKISKSRIPNQGNVKIEKQSILFSFSALERNEYFNLDGTCQNWASDLFDTIKIVSGIPINEITAGRYSGKNSTLRIHPHKDATAPCKLPEGISLDDMWQIRISLSKGGIHGVFVDNIFYVVWLDPQHNLYPDINHGGLRKVIPPSTCCKDRDNLVAELKDKYEAMKKDRDEWMQIAREMEIQ